MLEMLSLCQNETLLQKAMSKIFYGASYHGFCDENKTKNNF